MSTVTTIKRGGLTAAIDSMGTSKLFTYRYIWKKD